MQEEFGKSLGSEEDGWAARGAAGAQAFGHTYIYIYIYITHIRIHI